MANDLREALQRLLTAAMQFEAKCAKHRRLESERQALVEAITHAQLLLSVTERSKGDQQKPPRLRGITGGRRPSRSRRPSRKPAKP